MLYALYKNDRTAKRANYLHDPARIFFQEAPQGRKKG
jgi:hypothetical protein